MDVRPMNGPGMLCAVLCCVPIEWSVEEEDACEPRTTNNNNNLQPITSSSTRNEKKKTKMKKLEL